MGQARICNVIRSDLSIRTRESEGYCRPVVRDLGARFT